VREARGLDPSGELHEKERTTCGWREGGERKGGGRGEGEREVEKCDEECTKYREEEGREKRRDTARGLRKKV